jgi:polygalacturonase
LARTQALVSAFFADNVAIIGEGSADESVIDGRGCFWWAQHMAKTPSLSVCRPQLINFISSKNVEVASVTLKNPAFWNMHLWNSSSIHVHDTRHIATTHPSCAQIKPGERVVAINSDGIDVDSSQDVYIERVYIAAGDDAVAIKRRALSCPCYTAQVHHIVLSADLPVDLTRCLALL